MLIKKSRSIVLLVVACVLLNYGGKTVATLLSLPLWLDSFGTIIGAYILGPLCGAVVGLTGNILYGIHHGAAAYPYGLVGISIALIVGFAAKRQYCKTLFGTMTLSVIITAVSVLISTPLNCLFFNGRTGNLWGDGVFGFFKEFGLPSLLCSVVGEFYIDFLDKVITMLLLFWAARIPRARRLFSVLCCSALFIPCAFPPLYAQDAMDLTTYIQTVYSSDNGLPCGEANDVVQTNDGILWIGTYAGLYRYNGSDFRWMNAYDSVRNVNCLYKDEDGRLWIGTNDNGLTVTINEHVVSVVDEAQGLPSNSVRCIVRGMDDCYYVGTSTKMVVMKLNSGIRLLNTIDEVNYANSVSAGTDGTVAAVTVDGSLCLIRERRLIRSERLGVSKEIFNTCTFGADGLLYVGTSQNHIYVYDISSGGFARQAVLDCGVLSHLNRLYFTSDGRLFVCSDSGIGYFSDGMCQYINTDAFNNSIDNMTVDYQGNFWFASSRQGLLRLSNSSFANMYGALGMKYRVVNTVAEWQGDLYIGTDGGLDVIDTKRFRPVENALTRRFAGIRIRCIRPDSEGNLWVCTYGKGLICVFPDGSLRNYDSTSGMFGDWVRVVLELADHTIAAAGDMGISYIADGRVVHSLSYEDDLSNTMTLCLMQLRDGTVLAGSDGDGIAVIQDGRVVRKLRTSDGLTSGVILRTVASSDGQGTFIVTSNGLCYMDADFSIRPLRNFPYFNNYDVWFDGTDRLFVTGSAGIHVLAERDVIADVADAPYELLDAKSGLNSALTANSWNYCDADGNLYLSCGTGVYMVNMQNYSTGRRSYRIKISSITVDDEQFPLGRETPFLIRRSAGKIELEPELINYTALDPSVTWWLEGFDARPTTVPQSELGTISYTNLPAGEYRFHFAVLDSKTDTVLEQSSYTLIKERKIYDNHWFLFYMLLVAMIAVSWLTWFIVHAQLRRTLVLQQRELELARNQAQMGNETILAIAKTVDAKDGNTSQHSMRVSEYAVLIGREMGMTKDECENLRKAALLHDIGKIGIPDKILNKPDKLTAEEYAVMKSHVTRGAEILKDFTMIEHVSDGVLYHHEHYDGSGYEQGLKGDEIPLYGRIIGVADAFDAMTSNRVYRKKLDYDYVLGELERGRGTQFDPAITDIMLRLLMNRTIRIEDLYKGDRGDS